MTESQTSLLLQDEAGETGRPASVAAHTLGYALREAREASGLSIDEVARIIRFSPRQIEAMENNDFGKLPGQTVIRGFIRSYAKLLKLEASGLLAQFERQAPPDMLGAPAVVEMPTMATLPSASGTRRKTGYLVLGGAICLVVFIGFGLFHFLGPQMSSATLGANSPAPAIDASVTRAAQLPSYVPPSAVDTRDALLSSTSPVLGQGSPSPVVAPSNGASSDAPDASLATVAGSQTQPLSQGAEAVGAGQQLRFDFDESAWVEVRDASKKMLMAQNNPAGTQQIITGQPPFSIVIGNASHVRLHYGEQSIDLQPWTRVDVARLTLE